MSEVNRKLYIWHLAAFSTGHMLKNLLGVGLPQAEVVATAAVKSSGGRACEQASNWTTT